MNILMLNQYDIWSLPGTVRMVELSQQYVKRGHSVTLVHCPDEERRARFPLLRTEDPKGVTVLTLDKKTSGFIKNIKMVWPYAKKADIIHVQKCFPKTILIALWLGFLENKPVHYDWDDLEIGFVPQYTGSKAIYNLVKTYEEYLPRIVDAVSYSTEYVKELALQRGADPRGLMHGHVGADIEKFHPSRCGKTIRNMFPSHSKIIAYIGQLEEGSYVNLLLESIIRIIPKYPDCRFLVVGGGIRLPLYRKYANELRITPYVYFTDYVPHDTVPDYVAAADICVACFEDNELTRCKSPLKIAEYLAAGKVIVASKVGDIPYMVGDAGYIIPPGDSEKLAEGIISVLSNPENFEKMKIIARQRAENIFNWSVIAERFLDSYQSTIERFHTKN